MKRTFGKLLAIALSISMILLMGCGQRAPDRFKAVEHFKGGTVYVDTETGIGYANLGGGAMFPIYDKDGELYRPNGWRDNGE